MKAEEEVKSKQRPGSKNKSLRGIKLVLIKSTEASPTKNITHEDCHGQVVDEGLAAMSGNGNMTIVDQDEGQVSAHENDKTTLRTHGNDFSRSRSQSVSQTGDV